MARSYLHGEVSGTHSAIHPPRAGFRHHLFVSDCNHGASDLVEELSRHLATSRRPPPWWTSTPLDLPHCEGFLLYLTSETWTSGTHSATLGRHVLQALSAGVRLVLAHEMPGLWQEEEGRRVSRFETFFASDDGATPQELLDRGVYRSIAVPLKGGPLRPVSLALLHEAIAVLGSPSRRPTILHSLRSRLLGLSEASRQRLELRRRRVGVSTCALHSIDSTESATSGPATSGPSTTTASAAIASATTTSATTTSAAIASGSGGSGTSMRMASLMRRLADDSTARHSGRYSGRYEATSARDEDAESPAGPIEVEMLQVQPVIEDMGPAASRMSRTTSLGSSM